MMLSSKNSVAHNEEDTLLCSVCVYSIFTDHLDEGKSCLWNTKKKSCFYCLECQTHTCYNVPESTIKLVCWLLQLQEEYYSFDTADLCCPYNIKCMSILMHEFCELDSEAAKHCHCQATFTVKEPSMKHYHPASCHVAKTVDLVFKTESIKDSPSEFSCSSSPVHTVLSQIENEVANIQVSLNHLTTCLTSGTKALQDSTETSLVDLLYHFTCSQTNYCLGQPHIFY
ncbi:predicted protein [Coccidioides posadasii str. Silveira]|uniref:Predicted protein n=1 Tax=Coccidioides posadasii (strain RMSCC 757 / Silveira) TaxID=443226 RepID=E9DAS7_COCPS|nr:predicted protein [Coccidioides posadasii str. Silveira]